MKAIIQNTSIKLFVLSVCICAGFNSLAQNAASSTSKVTHSESSTTSTPDAAMWYNSPILWVVGAIILVLIIIAIASSSKNKNQGTEVSRRTTVTTTTVREED